MARVLIIDDDDHLRRALLKALAGWGHQASGAADGMTGHTLLSGEAFDLVITDIHMPGMDGIEIITRLSETAADTAILAISGGGSRGGKTEVLMDAKLLGANAVLAKPVDLDQLRAVVEDLLPRDRLPPSPEP